MSLIYPIIAKYRDNIIIGLKCPDLRKDFIVEYNNRRDDDTPLDTNALSIVIKEYIDKCKKNKYVIGRPNELFEEADLRNDELLLKIKVDVGIEKSKKEYCFAFFGLGLTVIGPFVGLISTILSSKITVPDNKALAIIIPGFISSAIMTGLVYKVSGLFNELGDIGKTLDDKINRQPDPSLPAGSKT